MGGGGEVLVVGAPWVLERLADEMEPQEGEEVSSHGDQSGLWCGEGLS